MDIYAVNFSGHANKSITLPERSRLVKRWWMQAAYRDSTLLREVKQELINTGWQVCESDAPAHGNTTYYITSEEAPAPLFWEGGIIGLFHSGYAKIEVRTTNDGTIIFKTQGKYSDEMKQARIIVEQLNNSLKHP